MASTAAASNTSMENGSKAVAVTAHQPQPKTTTRKVTPNMKNTKTSLDRRMTVDKEVVDELLLVCGVIGTETINDDGKQSFVPVTDCLNWLQDLQRALRRDEDLYRPISLLIGKWKVVEKKLLPLVMTCRFDTAVVLTVVKILVILTKPLAENTRRAGQMVVDGSFSKKEGLDPSLVAQNQKKLRDNALEQVQQLMEYKRLFTFHSSHNKRNTSNKKGGTGLLSIFVSLLAEPLSKSGASRTDADHLTIELVLHLIRNLLAAEPLLNTSPTTSQQAAQLHQEMISLFERELVLDIVLVVGQEMELRENSQYNLLMMEILNHILRGQDPMVVAKGTHLRGSKEGLTTTEPSAPGTSAAAKPSSSMSMLASKMKEEQAKRRNLAAVRHGHFGGTWIQKQGGKRQFVSSTAAVQNGAGEQAKHLVQSKRKNRMAEPFIGCGKTLMSHTRLPAIDNGPATKRANETLNKFCQRFMEDCYGPFMKSLKNEFRRDSVRLEESDKVVFFRLVWFFSQWWRASSASRAKAANSSDGIKEVIGRLIITMDVFTFNLVVNAADSFYTHKKYSRLAQAVALYSEMMHLLHDMYTSKDKTEHEMAMGLIDRLFYGQEALDQAPKLISRWSPGNYTREYLCDLLEVIHVSLKLLEANTKTGMHFIQKKGTGGSKDVSQKIAKMMATAADFDIKSYFVRKIVSNQMITMYTHLMTQYKVNAAVVNHRIIAMFLRLMRIEIASPDIVDADTPVNPLGTRRTTLEPMLYNIHLMMTMEQILNDTSIRRDKEFESLIQFCTSLMYKFWSAAATNPMLYVECLFRHVAPHRFCELVTNLYVNEDLRMISERAVLLEEHFQQEEYYDDDETRVERSRNRDNDDDDEEEELEFTGDTVAGSKDPDLEKTSEVVKEKQETADLDGEESEDENDPGESGLDNSNDESMEGQVSPETPQEIGQKRARGAESDGQRNPQNDDESGNPPATKAARTEPSSNDADSSDDDVDFGMSNASKSGSAATSWAAKLTIQEDSDEEE